MIEPARTLLHEAWIDLQHRDVVWQLGALLLAFALAWLVNRFATLDRIEASGVWKFGAGGLKRILAPLVALLVVLIARELLREQARVSVDLLHLAVPLLGSLALLRFLLYVVRHVFAPGTVLVGLERVLTILVWAGFALYVAGALPHVVTGLDSAALNFGKQRISLWLVLQAAFWLMITLLVALWLASAIEARLMRADVLHYSMRVALSRVSKSLLVLVALLVVLPLVGLDLTVLSVFGGALGVGLGFGLQKIASNYVSGFIILLDRSIRVGDLITADNFFGQVQNITARYTMVQAPDGREAIIPNETLITSTVLNHTLSHHRVRLSNAVSVAYDTDVDRALAILRNLALQHSRVLKDPAPDASLLRFADSGIELELGYWVGDPEKGSGKVRAELNLDIWRAFKDGSIEIPYPQRVVRMVHAETPATP
jgi:small-conductance mechanosensitive channel